MSWDAIQDALIEFGQSTGQRLLDAALSILLAGAIILITRRLRTRIRAYTERRGHPNNNLPVLADNLVRIVIYIIVAMVVLSGLGVDGTALVTFFGLATAAITLSLQDVLKNIFCGIYLLAEQPFRPGDRIRIGAEEGRVERVDLRVTRLRNDRQELIMVPNSTVFTQVVGNRSTLRFRPFTVQLTGIKLSYDEAEACALAAMAPSLTTNSRPSIRLIKTGPDGTDLEITVRRTDTEAQQEEIARTLYTAFTDATLTIVAR
jgi:small-conductance mechanosensitive channel